MVKYGIDINVRKNFMPKKITYPENSASDETADSAFPTIYSTLVISKELVKAETDDLPIKVIHRKKPIVAKGKKAGKNSVLWYAFKVELKYIEPKIWRSFYVDSDLTLLEFHHVLQEAMGWEKIHAYFFEFNFGRVYCPDEEDRLKKYISFDDAPEEPVFVDDIKLKDLPLKKGSKFEYRYDLRQWWDHKIELLDTNYKPGYDQLPLTFTCIDGARACPFEYCGGPYSYMQMLEARNDPDHPNFQWASEWFYEGFDPDEFSTDLD
jgi:hypothetical protein